VLTVICIFSFCEYLALKFYYIVVSATEDSVFCAVEMDVLLLLLLGSLSWCLQ